MKQIDFTTDAKANIRAIPQRVAMTILHAIHRLADEGAVRIKMLRDEDGDICMRVGDFRVRYSEADGVITILSVKNRKDAYR